MSLSNFLTSSKLAEPSSLRYNRGPTLTQTRGGQLVLQRYAVPILTLRGMATFYALLKRIEGFVTVVNLVGPFT
jgi:hypothetical protein